VIENVGKEGEKEENVLKGKARKDEVDAQGQ